MKLFIGLGNPGTKYQFTRHNVGFMAIDHFISKQGLSGEKEAFKGQLIKFKYKGEDAIVLKPQTFMNLSGESVRAVMDFYKINIEDIIVIYDDLDLPVGKVRIRENGGPGGHNGMKSIIAHLGSDKFKRIRVGIGKNPLFDTADYVLGRFSDEELVTIKESLKKINDILIASMQLEFNKVMTKYN
jgi:PTH1 family peptidyl-tRNA hydrolase